MLTTRFPMAAAVAAALAGLVLSACDPYIFGIHNGTDGTIVAVLIYEERIRDKGMQELRPGEGRTVGAVEFKDSRFVRVEAYDTDGQMIYCQRFSRPQYERNATYPADAPLIHDLVITAGMIACEPFRPFVMPTPRPTTPRTAPSD